jgi:REJ domain
MYPEDGTIYSYGTFIDLYATFEVLNDEPRETYSYGWIISKLNSNVDLAGDAAKPYYGTDITRVHIDNNIIEPNNYYNITFYVKGSDKYYNGMLGSMYNVIYIGIPPKNGKCIISPTQGFAGVTTFVISSSGWVDIDGIAEYTYFYSFDQG